MQDTRASASTPQSGFSLIELLVAMALLLVIMGAVYGIWMGLERTYGFTDRDMTAQSQARAAMSEMVEFIRTARRPDQVSDESYDLVIRDAGPFSLTLWTDVDRDAEHSLELVRFRILPDPLTNPNATSFALYREQGDATTCSLSKGSLTSIRLVGSNVVNKNEGTLTSPTGKQLFTYLDAKGNPLPLVPDTVLDPTQIRVLDPTQIRAVVITLRIDVDPSLSPVVNVLSSVVQPRNVRQ